MNNFKNKGNYNQEAYFSHKIHLPYPEVMSNGTQRTYIKGEVFANDKTARYQLERRLLNLYPVQFQKRLAPSIEVFRISKNEEEHDKLITSLEFDTQTKLLSAAYINPKAEPYASWVEEFISTQHARKLPMVKAKQAHEQEVITHFVSMVLSKMDTGLDQEVKKALFQSVKSRLSSNTMHKQLPREEQSRIEAYQYALAIAELFLVSFK